MFTVQLGTEIQKNLLTVSKRLAWALNVIWLPACPIPSCVQPQEAEVSGRAGDTEPRESTEVGMLRQSRWSCPDKPL